MNEYDSPNFAEYVYDRKTEGKLKVAKILAIIGYIVFFAAIFAVLCAVQMFWLIAILPIFTWMLVYFTWGLIAFDVYYEFKHGEMEFGGVKVTKNGRRRRPKLKLMVKEATLAKVYNPAEDKIDDVECVYDFSESQASDKRIIIYFVKDGKKSAVIFEGTARIAKLIASFCPNGSTLKGEQLHG